MSRRMFRRVRGTVRLAYHALLFGVAMTAGITILAGNLRNGLLLLAATVLAVVISRLARLPLGPTLVMRRVFRGNPE